VWSAERHALTKRRVLHVASQPLRNVRVRSATGQTEERTVLFLICCEASEASLKSVDWRVDLGVFVLGGIGGVYFGSREGP
jgi:hypothetical protein